MANLSTPVAASLTTSVGDPDAIRIALLLPNSPGLRLARRASEIAAALMNARSARGQSVEVTVGLSEPSERRWRLLEGFMRNRVPTAVVRRTEWTAVPVKNARRMFNNLSKALDLEGINQVAVPRDWGWNFQDCDLWLSFGELRLGAILPLRPTSFYCSDLAQRYVPTVAGVAVTDPYWERETDAFRMWRQGLVLTSDECSVSDIVSYAGVRRERIELLPDPLDNLPTPSSTSEHDRDPYSMLWLLDGMATDDVHNALEGLAAYYREGGRMDVLMAFDAAAPVNDHLGIAVLETDHLELYNGLQRLPYRSLMELERMFARVGGLWSSRIAGGEGEHVHDAVRAGLPLVGPRFALNERAVERLGATGLLYELDDPMGIADALHQLERLIESGTSIRRGRSSAVGDEHRIAWGFAIDRMLESRHAA